MQPGQQTVTVNVRPLGSGSFTAFTLNASAVDRGWYTGHLELDSAACGAGDDFEYFVEAKESGERYPPSNGTVVVVVMA